ncbi:Eef2k [Symbiodinium sp. CCMP2592]|nr:Eef2k [Symbiodinium sp. CCMP2592]
MRVCHRMRREPDRSNWVAKRYISDPDLSVLESDVIMQMIAKSYGDRFNSCSPPKKVDFVEASVLAVLERPGQRRDFAVEAFLDGSFTKHSSNSGFVADEVVRNTPHAFSHYTFEASAGEQIVVDIQGVDDLYTDPQIHTATSSASFGRGNMGIRGIALFFASHRCNSVCHQLGLTPFAHSPMPGDGAATEYGRDADAAPDEEVVIRAEPSSLVLAVGKGKNSRAEIYRHVHFALAMLHARHVQAFPYILQAAESGVAKAMAAAAYAYERFKSGIAVSVGIGQEDDTETWQHIWGDSSEAAHLEEDLQLRILLEIPLAWQFQVLSNNRARLESADSGEESSPVDERGALPKPQIGIHKGFGNARVQGTSCPSRVRSPRAAKNVEDFLEIRAAYRARARVDHPDISDAEDAQERWMEISEAYKSLTDLIRGCSESSVRNPPAKLDLKKPKLSRRSEAAEIARAKANAEERAEANVVYSRPRIQSSGALRGSVEACLASQLLPVICDGEYVPKKLLCVKNPGMSIRGIRWQNATTMAGVAFCLGSLGLFSGMIYFQVTTCPFRTCLLIQGEKTFELSYNGGESGYGGPVWYAPAGTDPSKGLCAAAELPEAGFIACGLRAAARAVERKEAWVVFVCTEGVPSALMQHLPLLCALQQVPVAVVAATTEALGSAVAPLWPGRRKSNLDQTVAVALLRRCEERPRLAELCRQLEGSLPPVRLPFLLPEGGAKLWRPAPAATLDAKGPSQGVPEGFIHLPTAPRNTGGNWRGEHTKKGWDPVGRLRHGPGKGSGKSSRKGSGEGSGRAASQPAEAAAAKDSLKRKIDEEPGGPALKKPELSSQTRPAGGPEFEEPKLSSQSTPAGTEPRMPEVSLESSPTPAGALSEPTSPPKPVEQGPTISDFFDTMDGPGESV